MKKPAKRQEQGKGAVRGKRAIPESGPNAPIDSAIMQKARALMESLERIDTLDRRMNVQGEINVRLQATLDVMSKGAEARLKALEEKVEWLGKLRSEPPQRRAEPDAQAALYETRVELDKAKTEISRYKSALTEAVDLKERFKNELHETGKTLAAERVKVAELERKLSIGTGAGDAVLEKACAMLVEARMVLSVFPKHKESAEMVDKIIGFLEKT